MKLKAFDIAGWLWMHYQRPSDGVWIPFFRIGRVGDCVRC